MRRHCCIIIHICMWPFPMTGASNGDLIPYWNMSCIGSFAHCKNTGVSLRCWQSDRLSIRTIFTFMHRWTGAHLKQDSVWLRSVHYHKHMIAYINVLHEHLHHAACIVLLSAVLWAALDHSSPMRLPIWAAWVRWMWTTGIWALILAQCDPAVLNVRLTAFEIRHADGPAAERPVKSESV